MTCEATVTFPGVPGKPQEYFRFPTEEACEAFCQTVSAKAQLAGCYRSAAPTATVKPNPNPDPQWRDPPPGFWVNDLARLLHGWKDTKK